ncbi:MAG: PIN domain-containing protein [Solirubrobacteraceae bacterium]
MTQQSKDVRDAPDPEASERPPDEASAPIIAVLDASALLALLFAEPGAERVADVIAEGAVISTVNLSEVAALLVRHGQEPEKTLAPVREQISVELFTPEDALTTAKLSQLTAPKGLSLGDRACLALAKRLATRAVTAERAWAQLEVDVQIELIRA